jgi:hypothetical protein
MNMQMQPPAHDVLGWIVVIVGAIVTTGVIAASVYWLIRPGETDPDHPKRLILRNDR